MKIDCTNRNYLKKTPRKTKILTVENIYNILFCFESFDKIVTISKFKIFWLKTRSKLNVHKTFRRPPDIF